MRTVYVITDARPRPLRDRIQDLALTVVAWLLVVLAALGQTLGLLISALDALVAARLGTRRLTHIIRLLRQAAHDSRSHTFQEDDL